MITVEDLKAAIAECQGERNPNANTCMKLAAYYTILREIEQSNVPSYSYDKAPTEPPKEQADNFPDSEFGRAVRGKNAASVWTLLDELMSTLEVIQPRLYASVLRRLDKM